MWILRIGFFQCMAIHQMLSMELVARDSFQMDMITLMVINTAEPECFFVFKTARGANNGSPKQRLT